MAKEKAKKLPKGFKITSRKTSRLDGGSWAAFLWRDGEIVGTAMDHDSRKEAIDAARRIVDKL